MNERREFQMSDSDLTELKKAISDRPKHAVDHVAMWSTSDPTGGR